jgi:hypothetical protein
VLPASGIAVKAHTLIDPQYVVSREQGMLILPQTTENSGDDGKVDDGDFYVYVEVEYSISNITNKTIQAVFTDPNIDSAPDGLTFEFGRQYTLELGFSGTAVTFNITVESWNDETAAVEAVQKFHQLYTPPTQRQ